MSPRPKRNRQLEEPPVVTGFFPSNGDFDLSDVVILLFEEYESIRLLDYDGLNQLEASVKLNVSRPTLTRVYESARRKVAKAFVENKPISIAGGDVEFKEFWNSCNNCHSVYKIAKKELKNQLTCPVCDNDDVLLIQDSEVNSTRFMKKGNSVGSKLGREGQCICPKCDYHEDHIAGIPCSSKLCPNCDIRMIRKDSDHHKFILIKRK